MTTTATDLVNRGVELLDRRWADTRPDDRGEDWRAELNLDRLNIEDNRDCVLGQLYGTYWDGYETLGIDPEVYGFVHQGPVDRCYCDRLTEAWREVLSRDRE